MYFKKYSIPELQDYDQGKKVEILKSIAPHWLEVVTFYLVIGFSSWLGRLTGMSIFLSTQNQFIAILIGAAIVLVSYVGYELLLLNLVTRKKVASKLVCTQDN